ncbi:hypothetical protein Q5P01_000809 [Channa striata]|uniref:Uncharacterized protein n=1 Tax=Channa striata TaxID=64152 RepID=A0AA88IKM8_CHASR|nr:hypothetical protein Q5P01_000809 [Channa striata]
MPWERLLSRYEFMIALASFRRNMDFYSAMDRGQLKTSYSQIVSFSPARMLVADVLISSYNKRRCEGDRQTRRPSAPRSPLRAVPCELSSRALALGQPRPEEIRHQCISDRSGELRGDGAVDAGLCRTVRAERQALELISCFVPDAETALSVQDETRVSAYIRTIMDISEEPASHRPRDAATSEPAPDHGHVFRDLLVSGLEGTCRDAEGARYLASAPQGARDWRANGSTLTTRSPPASSTAQQTPAQDLEPPPNVGSRHR